MLVLAILFFLGALYAGFLLVNSHKRNIKPLDFVITMHVSCALLGILSFLIYLIIEYSTTALIGFLLFVAAALGGFILFRILRPQEIKPLSLVAIHATVAIAALAVTTLSLFN